MFASAFQANAFQNNAFQIVSAVTGRVGGDDAWYSQEELKRIQKLQKKIAERQRKLEQSVKDANDNRKQAIRNLVDPKPIQVKKSKVQSLQVKADIPSVDTKELLQSISYFERQLDNIQQAVANRQEFARLQAHLRVLEAKRLAELDDEEALLILM
jgi:chromosome condensin MukBEF ATPase and DNA-binding subunit MukB